MRLNLSDTGTRVADFLNDYRVYHFHDTSDNAGLKGVCDVDDNRVLRPQAENLAAYLYYLQEKQANHFALIQDVVRQIAPFFGSFHQSVFRKLGKADYTAWLDDYALGELWEKNLLNARP